MKRTIADTTTVATLVQHVSWRPVVTIAAAAILAVSGVTPAQAADDPTGLALARDFASRAIEMASNPAEAPSATTVPQGPADGSDNDDEDNSGGSKDKDNGKGNPPGNSGKDDGSEKLTGRDRAADAIAKALDRGNGDGNGFGRGNATTVIGMLLEGESPSTLAADENHGEKVSAMVRAFNALQAKVDEGR